MIDNRTTRRSRWRGESVRLVSGVLVTTAVVAIGTGHIEDASRVEPSTTPVALAAGLTDLFNPVGLLHSAITNFTDATGVLSQADASEFPNFAGFIGSQISSQSTTLTFMGSLQSAENAITAHGADFWQTVWLYLLNLGWLFNSVNMLSLAHVVDFGLEYRLPGLVGLANFGLFLATWGSYGQAFLSFPTNFSSLQAAASVNPAAALPTAGEDPAAVIPGPPSGDPFLELVQKFDGSAVAQDFAGLAHNNDIVGAIAMQINSVLASGQSLGSVAESISSQILAGAWASPLPVTTDFFKEFVTNVISPDAFTDGLPGSPVSFIDTVAQQLDGLLENTVYATDLNDAALVLWP